MCTGVLKNIYLLILISFGSVSLYAQDVKSKTTKAACAVQAPSRVSVLKAQKQSSTTARGSHAKMLSCCKGAPSRFSPAISSADKNKKQVPAQK